MPVYHSGMILLTEQDVFLVAPFSLSASLESKDQERQTHHQHHQAARQGKAYPGACFISGVLQTRPNPVRLARCLWACCLQSLVHGHEARHVWRSLASNARALISSKPRPL